MSFFKLCHFRMIVDTEEAFFMQNVVDMSNSKNKSFCNKCLGVGFIVKGDKYYNKR